MLDIALVFALIVLILSVLYKVLEPMVEDARKVKKLNRFYTRRYKTYKGSTTLWYPEKWEEPDDVSFKYNLRTFDGGKNWYVVDYERSTNEVKIVGDAEELYPGLVEHLDEIESERKKKNNWLNRSSY